jgi:hypothetical protein
MAFAGLDHSPSVGKDQFQKCERAATTPWVGTSREGKWRAAILRKRTGAGCSRAVSASTAAVLAFNIPVRRPLMGRAGLKAEYSEPGY